MKKNQDEIIVEETITEPVVEEEPVVEPVVEETVVEPVVEDVEEEPEEEPVINHATGVVKAAKLFVREKPDGAALTVISKGSSVEINLTESTEDYYKVRVIKDSELQDGYCKKEFIDVK